MKDQRIKDIYEEIIKVCTDIIELTEDVGMGMNTTTSGMMGQQPILPVGSENPTKCKKQPYKKSQNKAVYDLKFRKNRSKYEKDRKKEQE